MRRVVGASWQRPLRARVDPDARAAPIDLADGDLESYRGTHPLVRVLPLLRHVSAGSYDTGDQLMAVTDAAGRLLWVEGQPDVRRRAEAFLIRSRLLTERELSVLPDVGTGASARER